jgi:hypothetical protein
MVCFAQFEVVYIQNNARLMNISHLILTEGNSLRILVIENTTELNENDIFELTRNLHYYNLLQNIRFRYNMITTVPENVFSLKIEDVLEIFDMRFNKIEKIYSFFQ